MSYRPQLPLVVVDRIFIEHDQGYSLRQIADGLTRDGIPTAHGGKRWSHSAIQHVLNRLLVDPEPEVGAPRPLNEIERRWRSVPCGTVTG